MYAESQRIRLENFGTEGQHPFAGAARAGRCTKSCSTRSLRRISPARWMECGRPFGISRFRILGGLFNFGIKRGFCVDNPIPRLDLSQRDPFEIQLYTVGEIAAIMAAAEKHAPGLVPFLAVSFFCGIRRAEALRLEWSAIDLHENFIKLPPAITKSRQGRHIDLSDNCRAWLAPYATETRRMFPFSDNVLRDRLGGPLGETQGPHDQTRTAPRVRILLASQAWRYQPALPVPRP